MNAEERLLEIIKNVVGVDEISEDTLISENIINSVNYVKLIVKIEEEFDIEIPDEYLDISQFETLKDFSDFIQKIIDKQ